MVLRFWRASIGCAVLALAAVAIAQPAPGPVVMQPGDTVAVDGTQIACLAFGANVQTLTERGPGLFCTRATVNTRGIYTVMRGSQATLFNSYVYALMPSNSHDAQGVLGTPLPPRSTPPRHFHVGLGDTVKVRGASFACSVFTSETISPGRRTIGCYATDAKGARPQTVGVAISDRLAAAVRINSNRQFGTVLKRKRHQ
jgi:hypothetical protein